ncbi:DUF2971 domain-containing protein [Aeromonas salmonicida]|uniref:DUF2971 domain-containing protein n=1 Tax=Aeromonas salmonicida TaxID=645 RepID=UPI0012D929D1|nr:DUF2971 domain-containing protein [Aeromonas salmonicida]MUG28297.1 DUF2971 domain-containing protein [Aeromonas salmonicida]
MKTFFKYYSEKFDVIEHLKAPSIKLATTASLNDPFEKDLSNELSDYLADKFILDKMKKNNANISHMKNLLRISYREVTKFYGIVSLTETHRNILMWAHYSVSHQGVCIGYKEDFIEDIKSKKTCSDTLEGIYTPEHVRYDSKRFDPELLHEKTTLREIINQAMNTKSDDWMYEKEHRCIVPFIWADKVRIDIRKSESARKLIDSYKQNNYISNSDIEDEYIFIIDQEKFDDSYIKAKIAADKDAVMLKNIDIKSITAIYLGVNYDKIKTEQLRILIESNPDRYQHISVYKYRANFNRFELDLTPVVNSKMKFSLDDIIVEKELNITNKHNELPNVF